MIAQNTEYKYGDELYEAYSRRNTGGGAYNRAS